MENWMQVIDLKNWLFLHSENSRIMVEILVMVKNATNMSIGALHRERGEMAVGLPKMEK